jgi:hypothetical protein
LVNTGVSAQIAALARAASKSVIQLCRCFIVRFANESVAAGLAGDDNSGHWQLLAERRELNRTPAK